MLIGQELLKPQGHYSCIKVSVFFSSRYCLNGNRAGHSLGLGSTGSNRLDKHS